MTLITLMTIAIVVVVVVIIYVEQTYDNSDAWPDPCIPFLAYSFDRSSPITTIKRPILNHSPAKVMRCRIMHQSLKPFAGLINEIHSQHSITAD